MQFRFQKSKLILILFVCFFISGCALKEKAAWLDGKIGEIIDKKEFKNSGEQDFKGGDDLSQAEKDLIEKYLKENNLNRYGDDHQTIYAGGTPLFDEKTGQAVDRFDYILDKHPEIFNILK